MRCTIVAAPSHERERGRDDDGHEPRKVTSDPQLARLFRRRAGHEPRIAIVVHGADVDTRSRIASFAARVRCCGVQLASASTSKKARWIFMSFDLDT